MRADMMHGSIPLRRLNMVRSFGRSAIALLLAASLTAPLPAQQMQAAGEGGLPGFSREGALRQRDIEKRFDAALNKDNLREWMRFIASKPHHVGSPHGKAVAEFIAEKFRSWGYETRIEEYHVLFPTPKLRLLEMTAPDRFTAKLAEPTLKEDATSSQTAEQLPIYNAYSVDGDVTGQLVYVNYGVPADYEELARRGIDVKGKIAIARYGGSWRGIKPKVAAEHGAVGCLIYSDPRDDGYFQGDVYPKGPYRMEYGAQRGSVADMPLYPGDPLTPGVGATKDAKRYAVKDAPTLTKIPVLPISYADALPLLRAMSGPMAPQAWRGALPIPYHLGPGPATVRLKLEFNWDLKPAYNVIATMRGGVYPEQWILRGNHHDAWVNGADDPTSGMVALMEEARGVAELAKTGWRPKRTIVYAAWDAEEPGLLGSTEWAEHHADELRAKAAVYINTDSNGRGFLGMAGSHTLEQFINAVARDVSDPQTGVSVWQRTRAARIVTGNEAARRQTRGSADLRIGALGSGSDYTPFLQHLGIASLNLGYGGEDGGGSYHSIYDSFDHYTRFGDPGFAYGLALAQTTGRATIRLASADWLPFEFTAMAETVARYQDEVQELLEESRAETEELNRQIDDGMLKVVADPKETYVIPARKEAVPALNFAPLENAVARLKRSAMAFDAALRAATSGSGTLTPQQALALDTVLLRAERALTRNEGLPRRPWFKHHIYAPGFYTGYGVKTLPGVREAIEQRNWSEAEEQIALLAGVLHRFCNEIDRAVATLR
jgi:N-acetylated-alpha-linked acidic dipeptidase